MLPRLLHEGVFPVRERHDKLAINQYHGSKMYKTVGHYCMIHLHGNLPHPKYSQDFGSADRSQGLNHELIPKYQV